MTPDARREKIVHRAGRLVPDSVRKAAARMVAAQRASAVERKLASIAADSRPILAGPWLGEVGFELLYWIPFLRWFTERYRVSCDRLIAVSRGGSAAAWYGSVAASSYDALAFMSLDEFKRKNHQRSGTLGEQKQIARTVFDEEIISLVRQSEGRQFSVLHPSLMYRLFAPYWWGHQPLEWVRQYTRFSLLAPPALPTPLPARYAAVKFYFNDCFRDTSDNRAFVDRVVRGLTAQGSVISLSTGLTVDDHDPCEPDIAAMQGIQHLLSPERNLVVQSAIVAAARRFVGTYGGFAYLAPLCGVPAVTYYTDPGTFSLRHLDLMRDVLASSGRPDLLEVIEVPRGAAV